MNLYVFIKVFADINLFFACIGALPTLFPYRFSFLLPSLCCAVSAGIAAFLSDHGKSNGRFVCLLLACLSMLLGKGILEMLILLPPVVYTITMILKDEWNLEYFHFRDGFRKTLIILGISVVLVHFGVLIESRSDRTHVLSSMGMLRHVLIYGVCGIFLQRNLRLGRDDTDHFYLNTLQLGLLTVSAGATVLAIMLTEWFLSSRGLSLGQLMGHLLQMAVGVFLSVFYRLFILVADLIKTAQILRQQDPGNTDIDPTPVMPMAQMQQLLPQAAEEPAVFPWWLAVLLLAAFTCILVILSGTLRRRNVKPAPTETVTRIQPPEPKKQPARHTPRSRLRKVYCDFLRAEKRKGHKLLPFHTSRDILEELKPEGNPEAASKLRSIYLAARYDLNSPVTPEQLQQAKDALHQYKHN